MYENNNGFSDKFKSLPFTKVNTKMKVYCVTFRYYSYTKR